MNYVVEIAEGTYPDGLRNEEVISRLAEAFELSNEKAKSLLNRAPGIVTKPIGFREAELIAERFRRAGLKAITRPQETSTSLPRTQSKSKSAKPKKSSDQLSAEGFGSEFDKGFKQNDEGFEAFSLKKDPDFSNPTAPAEPSGADKLNLNTFENRPEPKASPPQPLEKKQGANLIPPKRISKRELTPVSLPSSFFEEGLRKPRQALPQTDKPTALPDARPSSAESTPTSDASFWRRQLAAILLALSSLVLAVFFLNQQLHQDLRQDAGQTAQTLATVLANNLEQIPATANDTSLYNRVQFNLMRLQTPLRRQGVRFTLVNDANGNVLAGWYGDSQLIEAVPERIQTLVNEQLLSRLGSLNAQSLTLDNETLSLGSRPVTLGDKDATLLIARYDAAEARAQQIAWRMFLAGLIPILVWLLALLIIRLRQNGA